MKKKIARLRPKVRSIIERDLPPDEMEKLQKAFYAFGLLNTPEAQIDDVIDLYAEQAAGFYDPITKSLYLTDWLNRKELLLSLIEFIAQKDLSGELLLSHELTHALQDQHFGLKDYIVEAKDNLDLLMARHAVIEGDATMVGFNVVAGRYGRRVETSPKLPKQIQEEAKKFGSGLENLPPILREHLIFPYYGGLGFCREVLLAHGWEGVNNLYTDSPKSTEQIIHPEKYLKMVDEPKLLQKPNLDFLPKEDYQLVLENTFGELGTYIMLVQTLSEKKARIGSVGWGNDRFWVWEKETDPLELSTIWMTVWDSPLDAKEFYKFLFSRTYKQRRKQGFKAREYQENNILIPYGENRCFWMKLEADKVLIVDGFSKEVTEKIEKSFTKM